jgi:hypothetical protein
MAMTKEEKKRKRRLRSKTLRAPEGMMLAPEVQPGDLVFLSKDGSWLVRPQNGITKPLFVPLAQPIRKAFKTGVN